MSEETAVPSRQHDDNGLPRIVNRFIAQLPGNWGRRVESIWVNLSDTFQPENIDARRIPGEETQLEIHMAWYRDIVGHFLFDYFRWITAVTMGTLLLLAILSALSLINPFFVFIPLIVYAGVVLVGLGERFEYQQYRLLKTNARLVISIPQPNAWPLVDNIELKDTPRILDTNWSKNPMWRVFQFFTGARDLYISMSGLQFVEGKAQVRDALIIPDIMPDDVFELKKLVFKPK